MRRGRIAAIVASIALASCASGTPPPTTALRDDAITVASFNFPESVLLAQLYGQALRSAGFPVKLSLDLGTRELVEPALQRGLVEFVPEYAGSALDFLAGTGSASPDEAATHRALAVAAMDRRMTALASSPAQDRNGFVVTTSTAARYRLRSLSDLASVAPKLAFGGPPECRERPLCLPGLRSTYGLDFRSFVELDTGGPLTVAALEGGQVEVALMFSSDGQIRTHGFVLLADDRHLQPAENVTPVARTEVLARFGPRVAEVSNAVSRALTTLELQGLNADVAGGASPSAVASRWLADQGLATGLE